MKHAAMFTVVNEDGSVMSYLPMSSGSFQKIRSYAYTDLLKYYYYAEAHIDYENVFNLTKKSHHVAVGTSPLEFFTLDENTLALSSDDCRRMIVGLVNIPTDSIQRYSRESGQRIDQEWEYLLAMFGYAAMHEKAQIRIGWVG